MIKYFIVFILICIVNKAFNQNPYRFNIAVTYGPTRINHNNFGETVGCKIAEYYKPFSDLDFFAGLSVEFMKTSHLNGLAFPLSASFGYFGSGHTIAPVFDAAVGYNIYNNKDSTREQVINQSGKLYYTSNIGMAFNQWQSCPFITFGLSNLSIIQNIQYSNARSSIKTNFHKFQLCFKMGFLMK